MEKSSSSKILKLIPIIACVALLFAIGMMSNTSLTGSGLFTNILFAILICAFFLIGFSIRKYKIIKIDDVLIVIGLLLGLVTLICTIATWVQYGFLYSLIFKNTPIYYENAVPYDLTKEMYWLVGLRFQEVSVEYGGLFGVLCGCYLPAALFINKEENKRNFIVSLVIGAIGVVSLLTVPNIFGIIILIIASAFILIYKAIKKNTTVKKVAKYSFIALLGLAVVFYIVAMINAALGFKFTGILEKMFVSNGLMNDVSKVFEAMFRRTYDGVLYNFGGLNFDYPESTIHDVTGVAITETGIFEVELLKEIGVIGAVLFFGFMALVIQSTTKSIEKSSDSDFSKVCFVMLANGFFIYNSLFYDVIPSTHEMTYSSFLRFTPFFGALFVLGLFMYQEEVTPNE